MTDYRCEGKCGRVVTTDGAWCFTCWADGPSNIPSIRVCPSDPDRRTPAGESLRLRLDVLQAAYQFAFGPVEERSESLEKLSLLITVVQHEQEQDTNKP